jgi:hypothetical protein
MKLKSDFAILDVKAGRGPLTKHFSRRLGRGESREALRIPVTITGYIIDIHGNDDGVSREFNVHVTKVETE